MTVHLPLYPLLLVMVSLSFPTGHAQLIDWDKVEEKLCRKGGPPLSATPSPGAVDQIRMLFVGFHIADLYDVDETRMEFSLQVRFYEVWSEPALNVTLDPVLDRRVNYIRLPLSTASCLWSPDLYFMNSKDSTLYKDTVTNLIYKYISPGFVYKFTRYRLVVSCPMRFQNYPMDSQSCDLAIAPLASTTLEVNLDWLGSDGTPHFFRKNRGIGMDRNVKPLKFTLGNVNKAKRTHFGNSGNFTQLVAVFTFHRRLTAFLVNTYLPSLMVVCLSWVSFWLDADAVPGRVTLGVTAILTLATQIVYVRGALPSLDYMTAIDIWLFGCLFIVFLSLLEFTLANFSTRKAKQNQAKDQPQDKPLPKSAWEIISCKKRTVVNPEVEERSEDKVTEFNKGVENSSTKALSDKLLSSLNSLKVSKPVLIDNIYDRISRILFPSSAAIFTFIYSVYFYKRQD